jgi:hypothetical protein
MRRLIRQKSTLSYLDQAGKWTTDNRAAKNFASPEDAVRASKDLLLINAELVLQFAQNPTPEFDMVLSLPDLK